MSTDTFKWKDKTPAQKKFWVIVGFISIIPTLYGFMCIYDFIKDATSQPTYISAQADSQTGSAPDNAAAKMQEQDQQAQLEQQKKQHEINCNVFETEVGRKVAEGDTEGANAISIIAINYGCVNK